MEYIENTQNSIIRKKGVGKGQCSPGDKQMTNKHPEDTQHHQLLRKCKSKLNEIPPPGFRMAKTTMTTKPRMQ